MPAKPRFTRIPKVHDLIRVGVPTEVIPTYCALADFSNNKTGLCWPRMETLAKRLSRSPRTIQRHLHLLKEKGLVEFVERKRDWHGRFGAYVYRMRTHGETTRTTKQSRIGRRRSRPSRWHPRPVFRCRAESSHPPCATFFGCPQARPPREPLHGEPCTPSPGLNLYSTPLYLGEVSYACGPRKHV